MERHKPAPCLEPLPVTPMAVASPEQRTAANHDSLPASETLTVSPEPPVQIFPPPEPENPGRETPAVTQETILARIRASYDSQEQRLAQLRQKLKCPTEDIPEALPQVLEPPPITRYPTPLGIVDFPELHDRVRKYAAFVLRHTYQVSEGDLDDGLQAGCLRLWQKLQRQPELLADKSLAWIGKGVIYAALHATRGDWQYRRKTLSPGEEASAAGARAAGGAFRPHSRESRQTDIRADVHQAIITVAETILNQKPGKRRDHDVWALYGLLMLHTSASETSRLFGVREQSLQAAYRRVREQLQAALPNYAPPPNTTTLYVRRGRETLPQQDVPAIRKANGDVPEAVYEAVKTLIATTDADTRATDEHALEGIRRRIPAQTQAQALDLPTSRMQRAYERVHLMIGAQLDPTVRVRRPEKRLKFVFSLTAETASAVETLALELLQQPKSYEKLVALHAHIGNLAISTTAKNFSIPTSTLRYYAQQIGTQLGTPILPAREVGLEMR